jgi:hypothetical protein
MTAKKKEKKIKSTRDHSGLPCPSFKDGRKCKFDGAFGFCCGLPCRLNATRIQIQKCTHWDCGWCYRPKTKYTNGCVGLDKCDYLT